MKILPDLNKVKHIEFIKKILTEFKSKPNIGGNNPIAESLRFLP